LGLCGKKEEELREKGNRTDRKDRAGKRETEIRGMKCYDH